MDKPERPKNYLLWAILSTLFCCLPLGIVSIYYAAKVDGLYKQGEYYDADEASEKAKKYAMYGAIIGIVINVTTFLCVVLTGAAAAS